MLIQEHIAHVGAEGDRFADLLAAAELDVMTPTCPDWTIAELARHLGRVHRWAAAVVRTAADHEPTPDEQEQWWGPMPTDDQLVGWVREGVDGLVTALSAASPELGCWSFLPAASPLAFWARRQAHETTIHRVDIELAVAGRVGSPVPPDLGVDGVDELLLAFYSRPRNRVRSAEPRSLGITATDADAAWIVRFAAEGVRSERADSAAAGSAEALVSAAASEIYTGLWNRTELAASGDSGVLGLWRGQAHIRWT